MYVIIHFTIFQIITCKRDHNSPRRSYESRKEYYNEDVSLVIIKGAL